MSKILRGEDRSRRIPSRRAKPTELSQVLLGEAISAMQGHNVVDNTSSMLSVSR